MVVVVLTRENKAAGQWESMLRRAWGWPEGSGAELA